MYYSKGKNTGTAKKIFKIYFLKCYYWIASLLAALVGTTLPFWLNPPNFSFKYFQIIEFLFGIILFFVGFFLIHIYIENKIPTTKIKLRLFWTGIICLLFALLIGFHINTNLQLNDYVHESIFVVYIFSAFLTGVFYVVPPFNFFKRVGGEVILCVGVGMLPVLGAFIIQTGDLIRSVYLASLPIVASIGLYVWISELISRLEDRRNKQNNMAMIFSFYFASRIVTLIIIILIYATLVLAVFVRSSLNPITLLSLITTVFAVKSLTILWYECTNVKRILKVRKYALLIHLILCIIIIFSSTVTLFF